jgi:hypothetical protein
VFFGEFFIFKHASVSVTLPYGDYCHGVALVVILFFCTVFVSC